MNLDLTDEQTTALLKELDSLIAADRFPFPPFRCSRRSGRNSDRSRPESPRRHRSITRRRGLSEGGDGADKNQADCAAKSIDQEPPQGSAASSNVHAINAYYGALMPPIASTRRGA